VPSNESTNFLAVDTFNSLVSSINTYSTQLSSKSYLNPSDAICTTQDVLSVELENPPAGVCAQGLLSQCIIKFIFLKVKIQISQEAVVTRSAFTAELDIDNQSEQDIIDLQVQIIIKDDNGDISTTGFSIGYS
jgi:hypothetical protein